MNPKVKNVVLGVEERLSCMLMTALLQNRVSCCVGVDAIPSANLSLRVLMRNTLIRKGLSAVPTVQRTNLILNFATSLLANW